MNLGLSSLQPLTPLYYQATPKASHSILFTVAYARECNGI